MTADRAVVGAQIGRPSRADVEVATRCHLGLPVVVRMPPLLDDGTPFPTRFWLSCPLAVVRVDRLEAAGGVRTMTRKATGDAEFAERLAAAEKQYASDRDAAVTPAAGPAPRGGVGGTEGAGVKCLHAHYAHYAAGHDNPVGEAVAPWVEPLDCLMPCIAVRDGTAGRNPSWREPE